METNYEKQAEDFMTKTGTTLKVKFQKYDKHFADDKGKRDIYRITLKRAGQSYTFSFGQSLENTGKGIQPTAYDILAYMTKAEKIYRAAVKEYENVNRLFGDVIEELAEIN